MIERQSSATIVYPFLGSRGRTFARRGATLQVGPSYALPGVLHGFYDAPDTRARLEYPSASAPARMALTRAASRRHPAEQVSVCGRRPSSDAPADPAAVHSADPLQPRQIRAGRIMQPSIHTPVWPNTDVKRPIGSLRLAGVWDLLPDTPRTRQERGSAPPSLLWGALVVRVGTDRHPSLSLETSGPRGL
jgi:hypothetical protein